MDMRKKKHEAEQTVQKEKNMWLETKKVIEEKDEPPILGRFYERKTRFRRPIVPPKLTRLGDKFTYNVYDKLECSPLLVCLPELIHILKSISRFNFREFNTICTVSFTSSVKCTMLLF